MKLIFLDIDGVLRTYKIRGRNAESDCVEQLNRIIKITKAKLVISSSWRGKYIAPMQRLMKDFGVQGKVVGITPRYQDKGRGCEIMDWLHNYNGNIEKFIILDDEDFEVNGFGDRLIQTKYETGLTETDANEAVQKLT